MTHKGITPKHILIGTAAGHIMAYDSRLLDPRRPFVHPSKMTAQDKEEGLVPYAPSLGGINGQQVRRCDSHTQSWRPRPPQPPVLTCPHLNLAPLEPGDETPLAPFTFTSSPRPLRPRPPVRPRARVRAHQALPPSYCPSIAAAVLPALALPSPLVYPLSPALSSARRHSVSLLSRRALRCLPPPRTPSPTPPP
jgi:hypothetical protein